MINRVDQLAENDFISRISRARRWFQELRTNPQRFGSQSVKTYRIFSADPYDIQVTTVGFNNKVVEVVFTPTSTEPGLGGVFNLEAVLTYDPSGTAVSVIREDLVPTSDGLSTWRFYLSASDTFPSAWAQLKFYLYANSSGTFTATLL